MVSLIPIPVFHGGGRAHAAVGTVLRHATHVLASEWDPLLYMSLIEQEHGTYSLLVPTMIEAGVPNFDIGIWFGFLYPAKTPKAAVERMNSEVQKILDMPEVSTRIAQMGYLVAGGQPGGLTQGIGKDAARFKKPVS